LLAQAEAETAEVSTADLARGKSSLSALSATVATQAAIIASDQLRKEELSKQIEELRSTLAFMHPPAPAPSAAATDSMPQVATATSSDDTRAFAAQTQQQSAYGSNADAAVAHSQQLQAMHQQQLQLVTQRSRMKRRCKSIQTLLAVEMLNCIQVKFKKLSLRCIHVHTV
jgi:hypothetical protein